MSLPKAFASVSPSTFHAGKPDYAFAVVFTRLSFAAVTIAVVVFLMLLMKGERFLSLSKLCLQNEYLLVAASENYILWINFNDFVHCFQKRNNKILVTFRV
jgi:hypothetical protein